MPWFISSVGAYCALPWSVRRTSTVRIPGSAPREEGGPRQRGVQIVPSRHPLRWARPAAHWLCRGHCRLPIGGVPRCPAPSRGRLRFGRCCGLGPRAGAVRALHGAAAAAAPPTAAALPRLAAPPGETRGGCLRLESRSGERVSCSHLARREGRERGRAPRAVGRLQRCPHVGRRGVTALTQPLERLSLR